MIDDLAPTRPVMRYRGGKWKLADWVISHFPPHRIYVEPFGGAASVLMQKYRTYAEIYNDVDLEVVNVFRVLRDPELASELERTLRLTPYAREEFMGSYGAAEDDVERARRTIIKAFMGFGSGSIHDVKPKGMRTSASLWAPTGFRASSERSGTTPAHDWASWPDQVDRFTRRLQGVVIESRPALDVIETYDKKDALVYADPPYPHSTRNVRRASGLYRNELTDDDHRELAARLHSFKGMVIVSGYPCELYDNELYAGWLRVTQQTFADRNSKRTEVLWLSPRTVDALSLPLFDGMKP